MVKFKPSNVCKLIAITSVLVFLTGAGRAEPNAMADCAKMDMLLLTLIEDAGKQQSVNPEFLLKAVERVMAARRICASGDVARATEAYRRLTVNLVDRQLAEHQ
jgi:hypothetical protein